MQAFLKMDHNIEQLFCQTKTFLVADTQLYKRLCPSIRPSVGPSRSSWKVGKRVFPPLPTNTQLMDVYPALLA